MGNRRGVFWEIGIILLWLAGCGSGPVEELGEVREIKAADADSGENLSGEEDRQESTDAERIAAVCRDIYAEAAGAGTLESAVERMVAGLGENGYVAASGTNQVDMAGAEQVLEFIRAVEEKDSRTLTMVVVVESGFRKFDLETRDGDVNVVRSYYQYDQEGSLRERGTASYLADVWEYTPEGYLIFSGSCLSPETFVMTLSATPEHTALRVLPLEEKCRELNRKYLLPTGYERNNMFLLNWSEAEYGALDFYDAFDRFYPVLYGQPVPYVADEELGENAIYWIPEAEFEYVITSFFDIDPETLRRKTEYSPGQAAYKYRPRGLYEAEYPDIPCPEVVGYRDNEDGTIALTVNAVYPHDDTSRSFSHETVIRVLNENHFQFVSNRMLSEGETYDAWWHCDRLTE